MYTDDKGWFARWRAHRRSERQEAVELEQRRREEIDKLLAEYPVDRSQRAKTRTRSDGGYAGEYWGSGGGLGFGFGGGDCSGDDGGGFWSGWGGGDGGFWSGFGGDWGGGGGC